MLWTFMLNHWSWNPLISAWNGFLFNGPFWLSLLILVILCYGLFIYLHWYFHLHLYILSIHVHDSSCSILSRGYFLLCLVINKAQSCGFVMLKSKHPQSKVSTPIEMQEDNHIQESSSHTNKKDQRHGSLGRWCSSELFFHVKYGVRKIFWCGVKDR